MRSLSRSIIPSGLLALHLGLCRLTLVVGFIIGLYRFHINSVDVLPQQVDLAVLIEVEEPDIIRIVGLTVLGESLSRVLDPSPALCE